MFSNYLSFMPTVLNKVEGKRRSVGNIKVFEVVPDNIGKDAYKDEVMILSRTVTDLQSNGKTIEKKMNSGCTLFC